MSSRRLKKVSKLLAEHNVTDPAIAPAVLRCLESADKNITRNNIFKCVVAMQTGAGLPKEIDDIVSERTIEVLESLGEITKRKITKLLVRFHPDKITTEAVVDFMGGSLPDTVLEKNIADIATALSQILTDVLADIKAGRPARIPVSPAASPPAAAAASPKWSWGTAGNAWDARTEPGAEEEEKREDSTGWRKHYTKHEDPYNDYVLRCPQCGVNINPQEVREERCPFCDLPFFGSSSTGGKGARRAGKNKPKKAEMPFAWVSEDYFDKEPRTGAWAKPQHAPHPEEDQGEYAAYEDQFDQYAEYQQQQY